LRRGSRSLIIAELPHAGQPHAASPPAVADPTLVADPCLVLEPELDPLSGWEAAISTMRAASPFLKASCASASRFGWSGRAFSGLGYTHGVPMGGRLHTAPEGGAPSFIVRAQRDPDWANLDRIQIIKGWIDADGTSQERVYDVAVSDGREIGPDGRARDPVGSTVDIASATFTNSIGAPLLFGYWRDPDFDPAERAFYYVRVLEIPTPRWTTYDAARFGVALPTEVPPTVQDRAYSSPVWYTPAG
jgi:hypothetical protein